MEKQEIELIIEKQLNKLSAELYNLIEPMVGDSGIPPLEELEALEAIISDHKAELKQRLGGGQ